MRKLVLALAAVAAFGVALPSVVTTPAEARDKVIIIKKKRHHHDWSWRHRHHRDHWSWRHRHHEPRASATVTIR